MGTVVNLRKHRKRKAREAQEKKADENRVLFGLTKLEKDRNAIARSRDEGVLDGKKRDGRHPETDARTPPESSIAGPDQPKD